MKLETKIIGVEGNNRWLARVGPFTATAPRKQEAIDRLKERLKKANRIMALVRSAP